MPFSTYNSERRKHLITMLLEEDDLTDGCEFQTLPKDTSVNFYALRKCSEEYH